MNGRAITWDPVCLAPGVELVAGPNDTPLLYVGESRSYVRLSESGAEIMRLLAGSGAATSEEISQLLARRSAAGEAEIRRRLMSFLEQLDRAGALAHDKEKDARPQRRSWLARAARKVVREPRLRLLSWRLDRPLAPGPLALVRARVGNSAVRIATLSALLAIAAVVCAVVFVKVTIDPARVMLPLIIGGLVLHTVAHELSHALVGSYYEVKIREFGVALLYYFIPVAYTDRTDAYRLPEFRSRAAIALAGPMFDLYGAGASAVASCLTGGAAAVNFRLLMFFQIAACVSNLNPLLPGDGYHALEAWFGALNFRRRAFSLLFRRLTLRGLPPNLQGLRARQQLGHLAYAVVALGYTLLLVSVFIYNMSHIIALAGGR